MIINHPFLICGGIGALTLMLYVLLVSWEDIASEWRLLAPVVLFIGAFGWFLGASILGTILATFTITDTECVPRMVVAAKSGVDTVFVYEDDESRIEMKRAAVEGEATFREATVIRGDDTTAVDFDYGNVVVLPGSTKVLEDDGTLRTIPRIEIEHRPYSYPPRYEYERQHSPSGAERCFAIYGDPADAAKQRGYTDRT